MLELPFEGILHGYHDSMLAKKNTCELEVFLSCVVLQI